METSHSSPVRRRLLRTLVLGAVLVGLALLIYPALRSNITGSVAIGQPAPAFALRDLSGVPRELADFEGTPILLRFSSTQCDYCSRDFTILGRLQRAYGGRLQVIAVQVGQRAAAVRLALGNAPVNFSVLLDTSGHVADLYQVKGLPMLYLIDAEGRLRARRFADPAEINLAAFVEGIVPPPRGSD